MTSSLPSVSIIIAARAAPDTLPETLESIRRQSYREIVDVIVAAADEATSEAAKGVTVIPNPRGSTPIGLNLALKYAKGDVIVRCDAHSRLPPDYVERVVELLDRTGATNVGGMQVPVGTTIMQKAIAAAMVSRIGAGSARYRVGGDPGPVDTVYLGAFPREALLGLGGYDEAFTRNQDYELNQRIVDSGGTVWFDPSLRVEYTPRATLRRLARQYYEYGQGKRAFARKHPGRSRPRQLMPVGLVVALGMSVMASVAAFEFLAFPLLYLAGITVWSLIEPTSPSAARVLKPAALAVMHVSWGLGFLKG